MNDAEREKVLDAIRHEAAMLRDGQQLHVHCVNFDEADYCFTVEYIRWPEPFLRGPSA